MTSPLAHRSNPVPQLRIDCAQLRLAVESLVFALCLLAGACDRQSGKHERVPSARSSAKVNETKPARPALEPFAVVELFTSEGCSSCPPADAYLAELADEGRRIFPLSFHVDYWDHLGWKDPFSKEQFSERQRSYARIAFQGRVYTPQAVVNGREEFVGSHGEKITAAVERALARPARGQLALLARIETRGRLSVSYEIEAPEAATVLNLAGVLDRAANRVDSGENAGRTLTHRNVVASFDRVTLASQNGVATLRVPIDLDVERFRVVGYLQTSDLQIIAADAVTVADAQ